MAATETDRLGRLANNLLLLARHHEGTPLVQPHRQRLAPVLDASLDATRTRAGQHRVELCLETADGLVAAVDADRLHQVVDNLVDNALRVAPPETAVTVRTRAEGEEVMVEVIDAGPGFPEEFLPHAFQRFRRPTRPEPPRRAGPASALPSCTPSSKPMAGASTPPTGPLAGRWSGCCSRTADRPPCIPSLLDTSRQQRTISTDAGSGRGRTRASVC
jgi:hypothetical protein